MAKIFMTPFTERSHETGWYVVQAATLLNMAVKNRSSSFAIYAALELRMAIEQLVFTIIMLAKDGMDDATLAECQKKDGLFRILNEISPKYSLRCRFQRVAAQVTPGIPVLGEWDIKSLVRHNSGLSKYCHSQLIPTSFHDWKPRIDYLNEVYDFLAAGLSKPTAFMRFTDAKIPIQDVWESFSTGKITLEEVKDKLEKLNPSPSPIQKSQKTISFRPSSSAGDVPGVGETLPNS